MALNFQIWLLGLLIFRSESMPKFFLMLKGLFSDFSGFSGVANRWLDFGYFVFFLLFVQILQYFRGDLLIMRKWPRVFRTGFFLVLGFLTLYAVIFSEAAGISSGKEYIYFQF